MRFPKMLCTSTSIDALPGGGKRETVTFMPLPEPGTARILDLLGDEIDVVHTDVDLFGKYSPGQVYQLFLSPLTMPQEEIDRLRTPVEMMQAPRPTERSPTTLDLSFLWREGRSPVNLVQTVRDILAEMERNARAAAAEKPEAP